MPAWSEEMHINFKSTWLHAWRALALAVFFVFTAVVPVDAESRDSGAPPVTAKITLGNRDGAARPTRFGQSVTGGGNIEISQPASDTLVIRMTGSAGACANLLAKSGAALDFFENLQFAVEFSKPGHSGRLVIMSTINGVLSAKGKHSVVGVAEANVAFNCGPHALASIPIGARTAGGGDAFALNASEGPHCVPVFAGCYSLNQTFRIFAQQKGGVACGKVIAEFAPTSLPSAWIGASYPFQQVDRSNLSDTK